MITCLCIDFFFCFFKEVFFSTKVNEQVSNESSWKSSSELEPQTEH